MLEVVGSSKEGFTEATKQAIDHLASKNEKIHFFQMIDHRGSVKNGAISEFQVILKVAVEDQK